MDSFTWIYIVASLGFSVGFTAFIHRLRQSYFRVVGTTETVSLFKTSLGEFRLDKKHRRLQVKTAQQGWAAIDFNEIRELSFERNETASLWLEWLTGFNLWDFSGRYRDQVITCTIDVVQADGTAIPLYTASQLEEREFWLWGAWARLVRGALEFVKLSTNIDKHSDAVYQNLQMEFRRHGVTI